MRKPLTEKQIQAREHMYFKKRIRSIFETAGFSYLPTEGIEHEIAHRIVEVDMVFIYENILLVCEDTTKQTHIIEHLQNKFEAFTGIGLEFCKYYGFLCDDFPDKASLIGKYDYEAYHVFFLYFSKYETGLSEEDYLRFEPILLIEPQTLEYFTLMKRCIKRTSRNEIFRFLGVASSDIGDKGSSSNSKEVEAPIIYPKAITGLRNGVRVVSFMMSAEFLMNTCYVLRKDNWETSIWLYQRLLDEDKIKSIRKYLVSTQLAFFNNIIVGLPKDIIIRDKDNKPISITEAAGLENCRLVIPYQMNSICVIDGQHRIFAHYEGLETDKNEKKVAQLRKKLHLLVTGLIFPDEMSMEERIQFESEIFLDINSHAKPIPPNVLLQIEMLNNPLSAHGIARRVIETLNKGNGCFQNMFAISSLDKSKIKIASIVKFALRYLVAIESSEGKKNLYEYWDGDKQKLSERNEAEIKSYVKFCAKTVSLFFGVIKERFSNYWNDQGSRLLSVTSINGFIIALTSLVNQYGVQNRDFYKVKLQKLDIDFSEDGFLYKSSQYHKFAEEILRQIEN